MQNKSLKLIWKPWQTHTWSLTPLHPLSTRPDKYDTPHPPTHPFTPLPLKTQILLLILQHLGWECRRHAGASVWGPTEWSSLSVWSPSSPQTLPQPGQSTAVPNPLHQSFQWTDVQWWFIVRQILEVHVQRPREVSRSVMRPNHRETHTAAGVFL